MYVSIIMSGCNQRANKIQTFELEPVIYSWRVPPYMSQYDNILSTLTLTMEMELAHSSKIPLFIYNTTWYHYTDDYDLNVVDTTEKEDWSLQNKLCGGWTFTCYYYAQHKHRKLPNQFSVFQALGFTKWILVWSQLITSYSLKQRNVSSKLN
jgi:hypothetical protein